MKTSILTASAAAVLLLAAPVAGLAQGRGGGGGPGGGIGGGIGGGVGGGIGGGIGGAGPGPLGGGSIGGGFGGASRIGGDTGFSRPDAHATDRAGAASSGLTDRATRGSADVLPQTRAATEGVEHGSRSTLHASGAGADTDVDAGANATARSQRGADLSSHASTRGRLASGGQIDRTTRGSSDVLPDTRASATGVTHGSRSTLRASAHGSAALHRRQAPHRRAARADADDAARADRTGYSHRGVHVSSHASMRGRVASSGAIDRTTRGASDVLPNARASATGVTRGSMSTTRSSGRGG